jgi:hypothetical protein
MQGVFRRNRGGLAALVAVAALGAGGWAVAAGGSSGTIHACYSKRTGALRIAKACRHGEKAISWSKLGPQGEEGPAGPAGRTGPPGSPGTPGAPGTARAYAYVHGSVSTPSFDVARTRGFSSVTEPKSGAYCLTAPGIDPATTAPAVTAVYNSGFASVPTSAKLEALGEDCGSGQFEVLTRDIQSGNEVASPNLDFTIVVP